MEHTQFMERALELARRAEGRTSPNPMVGAVIVNGGRIVGEGYHRRAGMPHAEIEALRMAGEAARGATLYVTLEPCAHYGRTPPCTEAIIAAGITEVYYAVPDPNPLVNGKGHARLAAAGIRVHRGLCEAAARELNRPFFKYVATGRPYVTAKVAMSLDGKIATSTGASRWITGEASRRQVHALRNVSDAILVGAGTVLADDPELTTRLPLDQLELPHHPLRIVADSRGRVPRSARVFDPELPGRTVLATTHATPAAHCSALQERGVEVWTLPADRHGRVALPALLDAIGQRGMLTLLVEGGSEILGTCIAERLVDRLWLFIAPLIIGGCAAPGPIGGPGATTLLEATRVRGMHIAMLDNGAPTSCSELHSDTDLWIQAELRYQEDAPCSRVL